MTEGMPAPRFPAQLLDWAGNRSGGVRRPFDESSGRPGERVFKTNLLAKLEQWCAEVGRGVPEAPRVVLLVGGPGNGKTEAIETTMGWIDASLNCGGTLIGELASRFSPTEGKVPRVVSVDAGRLARPPRGGLALSIVQDASVVAGATGKSAAELLLQELGSALADGATGLYLCCVNRGVLDDALILAAETEQSVSRRLLESVTQAVSLLPDAPSCWPLGGYPGIAVWPMDMESLLVSTDDGDPPPAEQVLRQALQTSLWPVYGECEAGQRCPFCTSREQLSHPREQTGLLAMLRWYELGSGKRWSFRDLFSLFSYLLAGHRHETRETDLMPCAWAANLSVADEQAVRKAKPSPRTSSAIFELVARLCSLPANTLLHAALPALVRSACRFSGVSMDVLALRPWPRHRDARPAPGLGTPRGAEPHAPPGLPRRERDFSYPAWAPGARCPAFLTNQTTPENLARSAAAGVAARWIRTRDAGCARE